MADYLGLLVQCEELYAGVCFEPDSWPDSSLADWINGIAESAEVDKASARELRRVENPHFMIEADRVRQLAYLSGFRN